MVRQLRLVVIVEGVENRESQKISVGRWWNRMSHFWLGVPTTLIDEKTACVAIKESAPKSLVMVLVATDGIGRGRRTTFR
jgi:hypothetical protein